MSAGEANALLIYALKVPFPSPFNDNTAIYYYLAKPEKVSLKVYDQTGRVVRTLENGIKDADMCYLNWNGVNNNNRKVVTGVYFTRFSSEEFTSTKKVIFVG